MTRITIVLNDEERDALRLLSEKEMRGFRDQARFIIRDGLIRNGALSATIYKPLTEEVSSHDR